MTSTKTQTPVIASITFDCRDALSLARFWSEALRRALANDGTTDAASVQGEPPLTFLAVAEPKSAKNRVHIDLLVTDLTTEVDRLVELGANRLSEFKEGGYQWVTLMDPEGNEFDVTIESGTE